MTTIRRARIRTTTGASTNEKESENEKHNGDANITKSEVLS